MARKIILAMRDRRYGMSKQKMYVSSTREEVNLKKNLRAKVLYNKVMPCHSLVRADLRQECKQERRP